MLLKGRDIGGRRSRWEGVIVSIRSGQRVRVDGDAGTVMLLDGTGDTDEAVTG